MKMSYIKKFGIAVLAGILITQPIMTAVAPIPVCAETVDNIGTIDVNDSIIDNNSGNIIKNEGTVKNNNANGVVDTNIGAIENNNRDNNGNGTVFNNKGTIDNNYGYVQQNYDTITNNYNGADTITNHENATIVNHNSGAKLSGNYGTIKKNEGNIEFNFSTVDENGNNGYIEYNSGTIKDNKGHIKNNFGYVNSNTGNIDNNYNQSVIEGGQVLNQWWNISGDFSILDKFVLWGHNDNGICSYNNFGDEAYYIKDGEHLYFTRVPGYKLNSITYVSDGSNLEYGFDEKTGSWVTTDAINGTIAVKFDVDSSGGSSSSSAGTSNDNKKEDKKEDKKENSSSSSSSSSQSSSKAPVTAETIRASEGVSGSKEYNTKQTTMATTVTTTVAALNNLAAIDPAQANALKKIGVNLNAGGCTSFNSATAAAISKNNTIQFNLEFTWKGINFKVVIPRGASISDLVDPITGQLYFYKLVQRYGIAGCSIVK